MELYLDLESFGLYADSIGLQVSIPTWLLVGSIGLVYSIKLLRNDK
jgi:hypothetical protein